MKSCEELPTLRKGSRGLYVEELQDISFVSSAQPSLQTVDTELTEEQQEKNDAEALSFLENFM